MSDFVSIVILASGNSTRMGENKLLMELSGKSVIEHTLNVFDKVSKISEIILVCRQQDMVIFANFCEKLEKPVKIVAGGKERTDSALCGINACSADTNIIGVHDGARPLVTEKIIVDTINSAKENKAAIPVVSVKDTIKFVENDICTQSLNRNFLKIVQTPQFFDAKTIKTATEKASAQGLTYTDDSSLVEHFGTKIHTVLGSYENIKITTVEDIIIANSILESREK